MNIADVNVNWNVLNLYLFQWINEVRIQFEKQGKTPCR